MSKNDITGDALISKTNTKEYEEGWDRVFKNKKLLKQSSMYNEWNMEIPDMTNPHTGEKLKGETK